MLGLVCNPGDERASGDLFRFRKELLKVPRLLAPSAPPLADLRGEAYTRGVC